jgi:curved DNA-binding protein CbpA
MSTDLYKILEIPQGSGDIAVKRAYRRLSHKYHPDTRKKDLSQAETKEYDDAFLQIQEAYKVLSDPATKEAYDSISEVLEDKKNVEWRDNDPWSGTGWNIPQPTPTPYYPFHSSGSSASYSMPYTSGNYFYVAPTKARYSISVSDVVSAGLTGLVFGQVVYLYVGGGLPSTVTLSANKIGSSIPCQIISVHYGTAPGLPVYGDFELEEL